MSFAKRTIRDIWYPQLNTELIEQIRFEHKRRD